MPKKQPQPTIADHYIELKKLLVNRSIEKTDKHNARIKHLQGLIDEFEYGIICKQP